MILDRKTITTESIFEYQDDNSSCEQVTYFHFNGFRRYCDSLNVQRDSYDKLINHNYNDANF